jgi:hypothetical protein
MGHRTGNLILAGLFGFGIPCLICLVAIVALLTNSRNEANSYMEALFTKVIPVLAPIWGVSLGWFARGQLDPPDRPLPP